MLSGRITSKDIHDNLIFSEPVDYQSFKLYPVMMKDITLFQQLVLSLTIRKESIFPIKEIIKMPYIDFLIFSFQNTKLAEEYEIPYLEYSYAMAYELLKLVFKNQKIEVSPETAYFTINDIEVTPQMFDDFRRIIIIQNDVDFDIDDFINRDTELELQKAQEKLSRLEDEKITIEDYIDSFIVAMGSTIEYVHKISIRKFFRYIKRICKQEEYKILKSAECGGMVTFKNPTPHWMMALPQEDKYSQVKTDESSLKSKMG